MPAPSKENSLTKDNFQMVQETILDELVNKQVATGGPATKGSKFMANVKHGVLKDKYVHSKFKITAAADFSHKPTTKPHQLPTRTPS